VNALRRRQQRNFIATLLLSQGVPMLLGGDEIGRTQQGNNNAYCQDNAISWFDWEQMDDELCAFVSRLIHFRRDHPVFQRRRWFLGRPLRGTGVSDIGWFKPDGQEMSDHDWQTGYARTIGVFLNGRAIPTPDDRGEPITDDTFFILFNAHFEPISFRLPPRAWGERWALVIDTDDPIPDLRAHQGWPAGEEIRIEAHSLRVLRRT
jgi:glycogen operon protein